MGNPHRRGSSKDREARLGIGDTGHSGKWGVGMRFQKGGWAMYRSLRKRGTHRAGKARFGQLSNRGTGVSDSGLGSSC